MSKEKNNLEYMTEVSPEELKGLFFVDYMLDMGNISRWVRSPYVDARDLAIQTACMDWSKVKNYRVQSYEDLVQPVNSDGLTESQCEGRDIEFVPECQKIEYVFGSLYRIERVLFEVHTNNPDLRQNKGLYEGDETGLLVMDAETTVSFFQGSENALSNPETSNVLLEMSSSRLGYIREILEENGIDLSWSTTLIEDLLDVGFEDLDCFHGDWDRNPYIKELKERDLRMKKLFDELPPASLVA